MNIHHLELFYYVALHGGISVAARRIPYGIQQPAISAQIIQLENSLGTALFQRRPFKLTHAGEKLFAFIEPFFGGLDSIAKQLRGGGEVNLRIGTPETIQREYLPRLFKKMRGRFPGLSFTLTPHGLEEIEARLLAQEIDVGIAPLVGKRREGIRQKELVRAKMTLLVAKSDSLKSADALWKQDRISQPLITGSPDSPVARVFQLELQKRKIEWFPSLELNSQELIARYVAEGFGIGVVLVDPVAGTSPGTREVPLRGFPAVSYGLLWTGVLSPLQKTFFAEAQTLAAEFFEA